MTAVSDDTTEKMHPDGPGFPAEAPADTPADTPAAAATRRLPGMPTPEERLAETLSDDAAVGSDGTGMGELP